MRAPANYAVHGLFGVSVKQELIDRWQGKCTYLQVTTSNTPGRCF